MAEIDVRARASAIRIAKARVEFFSFFFILFGGLEVPGSNGEFTRTPQVTQELLDLLGGDLGVKRSFSWGSPTCEGYLWKFLNLVSDGGFSK